MSFAIACLSHAPTFGVIDGGEGVDEAIILAIKETRAFVEDYDPEIVIALGPDHFNGVLYEMMPPFCIGAQAHGVGDWGTSEGPLPVDSVTARWLIQELLAADIDVARSERLKVDHGILQPLEFLFGQDLPTPFVPVFVNAVGLPLTSMKRVRQFGEALGAAALRLDKRVLFLASGGLSHNPPIPVWDTASEPVKERITSALVTAEDRAAREKLILESAKKTEGVPVGGMAVNEEFDAEILRVLSSGDLSQVDAWTNEGFVEKGGSGALEIRSWIAAFAAMSSAGEYSVTSQRYWPVHPWGTGFAIMTGKSK